MSNEAGQGAQDRGGVGTQRMERAVALILVLFGAVVVQQSIGLGSGWTSDGPGSGYFPFYIGLIIVVSGVGILVQSVRAAAGAGGSFATREQIGRVASILVPAIFYVLGVQLVGIYVASTVYIALFMIVLGKYARAKSVLTAVIVNVAFFLMFEVWFKVPLFKGWFDPLRWLGY